jgi:hypothetical protein
MAARPCLLGAGAGNRGGTSSARVCRYSACRPRDQRDPPREQKCIRAAEKIGERFEREYDVDGNPILIYGITR